MKGRDWLVVSGLFRGLEALYQLDSGLEPGDVLHAPANDEDRLLEDGAQELLLLRENESGELEVALVLDHATLMRVEKRVRAQGRKAALTDDALCDTLPVLEGLSHLCYVAEAARRERPVSGLELETQAEVDKLALTLLSRWPDARDDFDRLVDRLYYRFALRPDLDRTLEERYHAANRVALSFSRRLRPHVMARHLSDLRRALREFWHADMGTKRALAA